MNAERDARIMELYHKGLTFGEIAKACDLSRNAIAGVIGRSGEANRGGVRLSRGGSITIERRYGRLVVLSRDGKDKCGNIFYWCACDCGCRIKTRQVSLALGNTKSCGCLWKEAMPHLYAARMKKRQTEECGNG